MRKYKYMLPQFTFYDRTGIQKLLEAQARKGWLLERVSSFGWRFRRIRPKKLHFAVTYFPAASQFDPGPGDAQRELFEFCAHSGWVLAGTTAQLQIFYNEQEAPVPIETDPMLELENIHRSAKKSFLPAYGLLLILALFQVGLQIAQIRNFPLQYLSAETTAFNLFGQLVLLIILGQELLGYALWYRRARKAAENGEFVETRGHRTLQLAMLCCLLAGMAVLVVELAPKYGISLLLSMGMLLTIYGLVNAASGCMKRQGASAKANRTVTMALAVALSIGVTLAVGYAVVEAVPNSVWDADRIVGTTQAYGMTFDLYGDEIPLKVEDLMEVSSPDYSYEAQVQRSPILKREEYSQRIWGPSELPDLQYILYSTPFDAIYDLCVEETLHGRLGGECREKDPAPWGAEQVWQGYSDGVPLKRFLLCYENKVVIFCPDWELTAEQMAAVGRILGG